MRLSAEHVVHGDDEVGEGERPQGLAAPVDAGRAVAVGGRVEVAGDPASGF
jgi:hypothetical protein